VADSGEQDYLTHLYGAPASVNFTYSPNYYGSVVDIGELSVLALLVFVVR
jgi:hypothetical protein